MGTGNNQNWHPILEKIAVFLFNDLPLFYQVKKGIRGAFEQFSCSRPVCAVYSGRIQNIQLIEKTQKCQTSDCF